MDRIKKSALFLNGDLTFLPKNLQNYLYKIAADGALEKLLEKQILPDFVVGDFDSITTNNLPKNVEAIYKPDQEFTDFYKCLEFAKELGIENLEIFGASGLSHDHFLGNLSTAFLFKENLEITFFDKAGRFFFLKNKDYFSCNVGDVISFYPFFEAKSVFATGLQYQVNNLDFHLQKRVGTRNIALQNKIDVAFDSGNLLVFIQTKI